MKKVIFSVVIMLLSFTFVNVSAFSVVDDTLYLKPGTNESIHLYANVKEEVTSISFDLSYSSYDVSASFRPTSKIKDNHDDNDYVHHDLKLDKPRSGKIDLGVININVKSSPKEPKVGHNIKVFNGSAKGETGDIKLKDLIVIIYPFEKEDENVTTVVDTLDDSLLDKIESKIVDINLEAGVFDYTVTVKDTVKKLDLVPVPKNSDIRVTISNQEISALENDTIKITLEDGKTTQVYNIKVKQLKTVKDVQIDDTTDVAEYHYKWKYIVVIVACFVVIFISNFLKFKE